MNYQNFYWTLWLTVVWTITNVDDRRHRSG